MRVLHLFAGAGGSHLAGELLGWESVGSVEINPFCQEVLKNRYPNEVIHGDICTFDATPLAGDVDGICGGFPCQDISSAGNGTGITGERSGLWKEYARIIGECRPSWVFIENSPLLRTRGLEVVLEDLASLGYDAEWSTFRASDVGAPHKRDRMWVLAYAQSMFCDGGGNKSESEILEFGNNCSSQDVAYSRIKRRSGLREQMERLIEDRQRWENCPEISNPWISGDPADRESLSEPKLGRVADGVAARVAARVDRLAAIGNGWVPQQAAEAFIQLAERALK